MPIEYADSSPSPSSCTVGVTSFEVTLPQWENAALGIPDLTLERFNLIADIVVQAQRLRPQFLVFPELSIPQRWAALLEDTLADSGISLVAGLEYRLQGQSQVVNEASISIATGSHKFPVWRVQHQPKSQPAIGEAQSLRKLNPAKSHPISSLRGVVHTHRSAKFSVFICSELTDARVRSELRGQIDLLFAVEFNQDIHSFASIIEATCLDVHAFVVQCNNRKFGDSRVRSPASAEYRRDLIRLRGGDNDHLVVVKLPVAELRTYQAQDRFGHVHHAPPSDESFKPTPDGFLIVGGRK